MKNTVFINNYNNYISNEAVSAMFNDISIDPQFNFDKEVTISLWHLSKTVSGYGHWRIAVELELNERKLTISTTTTDSMAIDDYNSEDGDMDGDYNEETEEWDDDAEERRPRGFRNLLSECIQDNEQEIIDFILDEAENDDEE